jgi:hypothetical protein
MFGRVNWSERLSPFGYFRKEYNTAPLRAALMENGEKTALKEADGDVCLERPMTEMEQASERAAATFAECEDMGRRLRDQHPCVSQDGSRENRHAHWNGIEALMDATHGNDDQYCANCFGFCFTGWYLDGTMCSRRHVFCVPCATRFGVTWSGFGSIDGIDTPENDDWCWMCVTEKERKWVFP